MNAPQANPVMEAALAYAARGWRVFPCDPNPQKPFSKRPLVAADKDGEGKPIEGTGWPKKASCDPEQIRAWWRRWPKALIGMAPGWAGAFVVDLDPKGEPVEAVEARLAEAIGEDLPKGPRTRTQSGGLHLWFRRPARDEIGNETPGLSNIDIRCDHGYVIVPPSVMGNGNGYSWVAAPYEGEAPDVPPRLLDLIDGRREHRAPVGDAAAPVRRAPPPLPMDAAHEARRRYGLRALDGIRAELAATSSHRGTALFGGACKAGRLVAHGAISEREAAAALMDAAEMNGLAATDGARSIERDIKRGLDEGRATAADIGARLDEIGREAMERAGRRAGSTVRRNLEPPPWEPPGAGRQDDYGSDDGGECEPSPDPSCDEFDVAETGDEADDEDIDMGVVEACAALDQSDTDNGKRLIAHFGRDIRVRAQEGGKAPLFVGWTGTHWDDVSGTDVVKRLAQRVGDRIKLEQSYIRPTPKEARAIQAGLAAKKALAGSDSADAGLAEAVAAGEIAAKAVETRKGKRVAFGVSSKNKAKYEAMMSAAAPHMVVKPEAFNVDPLVIVTESHTLRLVREPAGDGSSDPVVRLEAIAGHRRDDMVTRLVPARWDEGAKGPRWQAFLERFLPDPEVRRFVQVTVGLGIIGLTVQIFVFHYGDGSNGKSVFLETISRVLGPHAASLPAEAISGDETNGSVLKASPEIARLYGVRFVKVAEIKKGEALNEEFVKRLTGGEKFPARNLFEGFFEFQPVLIPHGSGNGYPKIIGTDNGIWRRMRVVHWPVMLAEHEMRNFEDVVGELCEEREAIVAWMVDGARIYLEEGLITPDAVKAQTEDMRNDNDHVRRFFNSALEVTRSADDRVGGKAMYQAYLDWSSGDRQAVNLTRFGRDLTKIFDARAAEGLRKDDGGRAVFYVGVRLKPAPAGFVDGDPGWSPSR